MIRPCVAIGCAVQSLLIATVACRAAWTPPEISGDITLNFNQLPNSGGYQYVGYTGSLSANHDVPIILGVEVSPEFANATNYPLYWSDNFIWDNGLVVQFVNAAVIGKAVNGIASGEISISDTLDALNVLQNTGPTQRSISAPLLKLTSPQVPNFEIDLGVSATFKFNVTVPAPAKVMMDQPAELQNLIVESGAGLQSHVGLVVHEQLINHGTLSNLSGTVAGNFINDGDSNLGFGATLSGPLLINGQLYNSSRIEIGGGQLSVSSATSNSGMIQIGGGVLQTESGGVLTNRGSIDWQGGWLGGSIINETGTIALTGSGMLNLGGNVLITNTGLIAHGGASNLIFNGASIIHNATGGVYDIQGDAGFQLYMPYNSNAGHIDNAGVFRKSLGSGTSLVGIPVNNTGIIECTSGTLFLAESGSSTGGTFRFANAGHVRTFNDFVWTGLQTASGDGTLEAHGVIPAGETATFKDFKNGAILQIAMTNLSAHDGAKCVFDLVDGAQTELIGGGLLGNGEFINQGNFEWTDGVIEGATVTNVSNGFRITGPAEKTIKGYYSLNSGSTINNYGVVTQFDGTLVRVYGANTPGNFAMRINNFATGVYEMRDGSSLESGG
jgi:hypothetical protein